MNVAGSTAAADGETKKVPPTKGQAHDAVVAAYSQAVKSGKRPGAVLLQEYSWAGRAAKTGAGEPSLGDLAARLGPGWAEVRQWGDTGGRDAVVLYDTSIYMGARLSTSGVMASSDGTRLGNGVAAARRAGISSYEGRWAGVQLAALDPSTEKPTSLQFLLVSYHGRSNKPAGGAAGGGLSKLEANVKRALAQDFVIEVAKAAIKAKLPPVVAGGFEQSTVPALVAGDWNAERIAFQEFRGLAVGDHPFACTSHGAGNELGVLSARRNAYGMLRDELDYVVAVNPERRHELSCTVAVHEVRALPHLSTHRRLGLFDHDPLLVMFQVGPDPAQAAAGRAPRHAAVVAAARITVSEELHAGRRWRQ
jgi:hypothetical protein